MLIAFLVLFKDLWQWVILCFMYNVSWSTLLNIYIYIHTYLYLLGGILFFIFRSVSFSSDFSYIMWNRGQFSSFPMWIFIYSRTIIITQLFSSTMSWSAILYLNEISVYSLFCIEFLFHWSISLFLYQYPLLLCFITQL